MSVEQRMEWPNRWAANCYIIQIRTVDSLSTCIGTTNERKRKKRCVCVWVCVGWLAVTSTVKSP